VPFLARAQHREHPIDLVACLACARVGRSPVLDHVTFQSAPEAINFTAVSADVAGV
jgi:hypothetical protein